MQRLEKNLHTIKVKVQFVVSIIMMSIVTTIISNTHLLLYNVYINNNTKFHCYFFLKHPSNEK